MCCSNRRRGHCARPDHRTPVLVVLGKLAYDKYQERKQLRNEEASRSQSLTPEQIQLTANTEILEKAGIAPPKYRDVVDNQSVKGNDTKKEALPTYSESRENDDNLSDDEEFYEVVDGRRVMNEDLVAAQAEFVRKWKARRTAA